MRSQYNSDTSPSLSPLKLTKAASTGYYHGHQFSIGLSQNSPILKTHEDLSPKERYAHSSTSSPNKMIRISRAKKSTLSIFTFENLTSFQEDAEDKDDSHIYKKTLQEPLQLEKLVSVDESPQKTLGGEAVNNFYTHYKKLEKIKDINAFTQVRDATYTSMLGKTESLNLLPSKVGLIKHNGESSKVKLNHFRLGDKYAEVLSEGLKSVKELNTLELANNRLTPVGANHILPKLNNLTQIIDLSGNSIGKIGCSHLCNILSMKNSKLIEVNIEGNKLGDVSIGQLCEVIAYNNSIRRLNIGKNFLSDKVADKISRMIEMNTTLEELYLPWNQIKSPGGKLIIAGLKSANKLKVLDLSWNSLGMNGSDFSKAFATYISTNTTLVHLDLSNNYINKQDATTIAEGLKSNHTLFGLHFHGNTGYIDCKGFLVIPEGLVAPAVGNIVNVPINGVKIQPESLKHHIGNWEGYKDVCWVCEGWRPVHITWKPSKSGEADQDPIFAHVSYEGYKQIFLPRKNDFKNTRMAPPLKFDYFFTIDGVQTHAEGQPYGKPENPCIKIQMDEEEEEKSVKLDFINIFNKGAPKRVLDDNYEVVSELNELGIKPRVLDENYVPTEVVLERPPWKFAASIFRNYRSDTSTLLDECFKVDFDGSRISKIVKNPEDLAQVREVLHRMYPILKDCYKYYAAFGPPSDIWCMPLNSYTEFCSNCNIVDGKTLKLSDLDRIFIAAYTNPEKEKNPRNPDRALVRYQFLEVLVRIADQKYISNGTVSTYAEAVNLLLEETIKPNTGRFDHQQWRVKNYWNEQVDTIYKSYLPILRGLYRKYSGQKTLLGQKKSMCLEEFMRFMSDAKLLNDSCGERDATLAFGLSMMTQIDELHSDRIYQMQFVEFLEALARVVEKASPSPPAASSNSLNSQRGEPNSDMSAYEQRFNQPLHVKLENLMPAFFSICGNDVKDIWILPETPIVQMEEEFSPKQRSPTKKRKILKINPTHSSSIEPYEGVNALQI